MFQLKEVINSKYNRNDTDRYHRSVLFLIENTVTGLFQLFQMDRISKNTAALRCNTRQCGHRLSLEHALATEPSGKNRGRIIAKNVTKEDMLNASNWLKVYHDHTKNLSIYFQK